ncbi:MULTISPECIES: sensor histidine kinase [Bacillaceae]|uniref:histidine kinase n=1 Tax=Gottfriedia luciferensis TaxID=178774 RepID=A0ABX2ZZL2_9BACI|nr:MULTISPECIES: sensor histidine kinase [Bacillaceae]ODG92508.1 two-component sensor histidine kinase [Gottfriedia luciferensis]PGZ93003.1 sensor histidine kinase [Bacillus sp. AFS029533]SFD39154.1 His Kinase A (phospho-acceptor) domain-containing protein [Bacillus sp. UNCCL81]
MIYLLVLFLAASLIFNIYLVQHQRVSNQEISYVKKKLQSIIEQKTDENVLLYTSNSQMKSLLIQINRLLEHNQKTVANFHSVERSMRKMLSNISHDLKTPLTVILGYIEIILHDEIINQEKEKSLLQTVHLKAEEVLDLINRFFDLVKLESNDVHLEMSKIELGEICKKTILDYYEILTKKEFDVSINIPNEQKFIWGNKGAVERILNNLISNALQYGSDGKVIGLHLRSTEDKVYIDVFDRGKGILEDGKDRVFERLYTMEDSRNKLYQGSGLGLTITKRLVEQLGGKISLESIPNHKTTFTIELKRMTY